MRPVMTFVDALDHHPPPPSNPKSPNLQKEKRRTNLRERETEFLRIRRARLGCSDFEFLKTIGRGAFGEVGTWDEVYIYAHTCHHPCCRNTCGAPLRPLVRKGRHRNIHGSRIA